MNEPLCLRCRYFYPEDGDRDGLPDGGQDVYYIQGECRRHCPVACEPSEDPRRVNYAYWPVVLACDGCGEFQARERAAQHAPRSDDTVATTRSCAGRAAS